MLQPHNIINCRCLTHYTARLLVHINSVV